MATLTLRALFIFQAFLSMLTFGDDVEVVQTGVGRLEESAAEQQLEAVSTLERSNATSLHNDLDYEYDYGKDYDHDYEKDSDYDTEYDYGRVTSRDSDDVQDYDYDHDNLGFSCEMSHLAAAATGNLAGIPPTCISCLVPCNIKQGDARQQCGLACAQGTAGRKTPSRPKQGRDKGDKFADDPLDNGGDGGVRDSTKRRAEWIESTSSDYVDDFLSNEKNIAAISEAVEKYQRRQSKSEGEPSGAVLASVASGPCQNADLAKAESGSLAGVPSSCLACLTPCATQTGEARRKCGAACAKSGAAGAAAGDGKGKGKREKTPPSWSTNPWSKEEQQASAEIQSDALDRMLGKVDSGSVAESVATYRTRNDGTTEGKGKGKGKKQGGSAGAACSTEEVLKASKGAIGEVRSSCVSCLMPCSTMSGSARAECGQKCAGV